MLACTETITLVRCDGDVYTSCQIDSVSWYDKTQVVQSNNGLQFSNIVKVRIPADVVEQLPMLPCTGDHVFRGTVKSGDIIATPVDLARYNPRKVMTVGDNVRGKLPHVVVIAQ